MRQDPSRTSEHGAGWGCAQIGTFVDLAPDARPLSWLRPGPLWASRNDTLVRWFGDPTDDQRRAWMRRLDEYAAAAGRPAPARDRLVTTYADRPAVSVAVLGDPGEGDASQWCVVPVFERVGADTDFTVVCGDVIYPAGGIATYGPNFYTPYARYRKPIYGLPGNHDWYDGLTGFMTTFCDAPPDAGGPRVRGPGPWWRRALRSLLWHHPRPADAEAVARMRQLRGMPEQQAVQPGPYCAVDAGPVRLVLIDTGILGGIDAEQGEWLREISRGDRPKILLTGKPLLTYAAAQPCHIEGGGTVDEIVADRANNYIAAIGGDDHNYQRYPVTLDGRTIQYVVAGGSGAYLSATHQIPNADQVPGSAEEHFRCYPLRGDSLAHFSRRYDELVPFVHLTLTPDEATAVMAQRVGIEPPRDTGVAVTPALQRTAMRVFPLPARGSAPAHNLMSVLFDSNAVPQFKSLLRLDATDSEVVISCWAATGCLEQERDPVLEDRCRAVRGVDGGWTWHSETPGRRRP